MAGAQEAAESDTWPGAGHVSSRHVAAKGEAGFGLLGSLGHTFGLGDWAFGWIFSSF